MLLQDICNACYVLGVSDKSATFSIVDTSCKYRLFFAGRRIVYCMIFDNIKVLVLSLQSQDRGTVGIDTLGVFCTGCSNQNSEASLMLKITDMMASLLRATMTKACRWAFNLTEAVV